MGKNEGVGGEAGRGTNRKKKVNHNLNQRMMATKKDLRIGNKIVMKMKKNNNHIYLTYLTSRP